MSIAVLPRKRKTSPSVEPRSRRGTPTWEIARLYPAQGDWSEEEYFNLDTNQLVEYADGCLEFLPMPTTAHQFIARFLFRLLDRRVASQRLGNAFFTPFRVRIRRGKFREPDVLFVAKGRKLEKQFSHGADLVIEILSEGEENRARDLVEKRKDYAAARIPEYWIVDPETQAITVLTLKGRAYRAHGKFKSGQTATSVLLPDFTVDVAACFAAPEED
jgi:Uma2 family endonuclease